MYKVYTSTGVSQRQTDTRSHTHPHTIRHSQPTIWPSPTPPDYLGKMLVRMTSTPVTFTSDAKS